MRDAMAAGEPMDDMILLMGHARRNIALLPHGLRANPTSEMAAVVSEQCTSAHVGYYFRLVRRQRLARATYDLLIKMRARCTKGDDPHEILLFISENSQKLLEAERESQKGIQAALAAIGQPLLGGQGEDSVRREAGAGVSSGGHGSGPGWPVPYWEAACEDSSHPADATTT